EKRGFSHLYLANVLGAVVGTLATAFVLVELLGFQHTLILAALCNFAIGIVGLGVFRRGGLCPPVGTAQPSPTKDSAIKHPTKMLGRSGLFIYSVLFATGFVSMAMEVVWTRAFSAVLGTFVYSFAMLLAIYLISTCLGSLLYRHACGFNQKFLSRE